jgi:hypothetical protein
MTWTDLAYAAVIVGIPSMLIYLHNIEKTLDAQYAQLLKIGQKLERLIPPA